MVDLLKEVPQSFRIYLIEYNSPALTVCERHMAHVKGTTFLFFFLSMSDMCTKDFCNYIICK